LFMANLPTPLQFQHTADQDNDNRVWHMAGLSYIQPGRRPQQLI